MLNKFIYLFILFSPVCTFSQTHISADSANKLINNGGDCSGRTFTKIEKIPSLSIPEEAYEDSISSYLKSKNAYFNNERITFAFVVTCHSEIKNLQKIKGNSSNENELKMAILKFSNFWLPGRQNGYIDNSYVKFELNFEDNKLSTTIFQ